MHYLSDETENFLIWIWSHGGSGVWDKASGRTVMMFYPDLIFSGVKRKHLQELAGSKGYGGPLAKLKHGDKRWQKVEVVLTTEGQRWADSPYLRSRHGDHPSRDDVKAAKAIKEAKAREQKNIAELTKRLEQFTQGEN